MGDVKVTRRRCACCGSSWVADDGIDVGMVRGSGNGWKAGVLIDTAHGGTYVHWFAGAWRSRAFAVEAIRSWMEDDG